MLRKLSPAHRKRAIAKNRTVRISEGLMRELNKLRHGKSWDAWLRYSFGLPDRHGELRPAIEGILETTSGIFFLKLHDTSWEEVEQLAYRAAEKLQGRIGNGTPAKYRALRMRESR